MLKAMTDKYTDIYIRNTRDIDRIPNRLRELDADYCNSVTIDMTDYRDTRPMPDSLAMALKNLEDSVTPIIHLTIRGVAVLTREACDTLMSLGIMTVTLMSRDNATGSIAEGCIQKLSQCRDTLVVLHGRWLLSE